jgi:uncharacterized protein
MSWTQALMKLQDLDHTVVKNHQRLREIELQLRNNAELVAAQKQVVQLTQVAAAARKQQQDLEFELGQVQIKRDLTETNLYSGRITNSRELQDLQTELQSLRRRIADLENALLEAMMAREEADEAARAAEEQLEQVRMRLEQVQGVLVAEQTALETHNATLQGEQQQLRRAVPAEALDSYDYLKDRTGYMPVARLRSGVCSVCGTEVLRPTQQKVQRGQIAYCDTCLRLLVE